MPEENYSISFVIPCLNEQATLPLVLEKINRLRSTTFADRAVEIVVADNGSTDDSVAIAESHGARVEHCPVRGYGAALQWGIRAAEHDLVIFADADDTYDFLESPRLVEELERGFDMVVGSRLDGEIHVGAMPLLHRRLGTPVLNLFINLLHARGGNRVRDCNSGFRCFKREAFAGWGVESTGMEFASEMLVKALKAQARFSQVPISLYPDRVERQPHLRTWRDGMRHLMQVFLEAPQFFHHVGLAISMVSWMLLLAGWVFGPFVIGFASVFGLHTMMFALLGSLFGLSVWSSGLLLAARVPSKLRLYSGLLEMSEGQLFWSAVVFVAISIGFFLGIVVRWAMNDFRFLALERETMLLTAFGANGILLVANVLTARLLKQTGPPSLGG